MDQSISFKAGIIFCFILIFAAAPGLAEEDNQDLNELAKASQNPVADLISVPLQNNLNYGMGPDDDKIQYLLNIQPVVPIPAGPLNIITRTILPVIYQQGLYEGMDDEFGLSDLNISIFLSPSASSKFIWGVGPVLLFPTATEEILGTEKWGAGPTFVGLGMVKQWVFGGLINNVWSYAGNEDRDDVNMMMVQPFVNYNLPKAWAVSFAPMITANWEAEDNDDTWTVPVGLGVSKIVKMGPLPVNFALSYFYNVLTPEYGPDMQFRFAIVFMFPGVGK